MSGRQPEGVTRERYSTGSGGPPSEYTIRLWGGVIGMTRRGPNGTWRCAEAGTFTEDNISQLRRAGTQAWSRAFTSHSGAARVLVRLRDTWHGAAHADENGEHDNLRRIYFPPKLCSDVQPLGRQARHEGQAVDVRDNTPAAFAFAGCAAVWVPPRHEQPSLPPIDMRDANNRHGGEVVGVHYPRETPRDVVCAQCGEAPLFGFAEPAKACEQLCPYCGAETLVRPMGARVSQPFPEFVRPLGTRFVTESELFRLRFRPASEYAMVR
jgi:hypothetical protein